MLVSCDGAVNSRWRKHQSCCISFVDLGHTDVLPLSFAPEMFLRMRLVSSEDQKRFFLNDATSGRVSGSVRCIPLNPNARIRRLPWR
jgi:hypothetical protein